MECVACSGCEAESGGNSQRKGPADRWGGVQSRSPFGQNTLRMLGKGTHALEVILLTFLVAFAPRPARAAQTTQTPAPSQAQETDELIAVPNRPTFASTGEMVPLGVFEIEYGFEAAKGHQNINGLLKWGAVKNLELWFVNLPLERDAGTTEVGDCGAGFKYKLFSQAKARPTMSVLYVATIPTATPGPGAGAVGHFVNLLVSKDFGKNHFDLNGGVQLLGRPGTTGFDRNYFISLSYSRPLRGKWGYTAEAAGYSRANAGTPAKMTLLGAATYNVSPRFVLDCGAYVAVYGQLPRATFFSGLTYSVGNLYHLHASHSRAKN